MTGTDMEYQTSTTEMHKKHSKRTLKNPQKNVQNRYIYIYICSISVFKMNVKMISITGLMKF